jgi:hypothetical protein
MVSLSRRKYRRQALRAALSSKIRATSGWPNVIAVFMTPLLLTSTSLFNNSFTVLVRPDCAAAHSGAPLSMFTSAPTGNHFIESAGGGFYEGTWRVRVGVIIDQCLRRIRLSEYDGRHQGTSEAPPRGVHVWTIFPAKR